MKAKEAIISDQSVQIVQLKVELNLDKAKLNKLISNDTKRQKREVMRQKKKQEMEKILKMQELEWKWNHKRESGFPTDCGKEEIQLLEESISDLK